MTNIEQKYYEKISTHVQFAKTLEHLCPKNLYYISDDDDLAELIELTFSSLVPQFSSNVSNYVIDLNTPLIAMYKFDGESRYMGLVEKNWDDEWYFDVYSRDKRIFETANEAFNDKIYEYSLETNRLCDEQVVIERRIFGIKSDMKDLIVKRDNLKK